MFLVMGEDDGETSAADQQKSGAPGPESGHAWESGSCKGLKDHGKHAERVRDLLVAGGVTPYITKPSLIY